MATTSDRTPPTRTSPEDAAAGEVPLSHAADVIRMARAYAATGDRAGVERMIEHARVFLAHALAEVQR